MTVIDIRGKSIKLGFTFPSSATVLRREIHERIQAENQAAAEGRTLPDRRQVGTKRER